MTKEDKLRNYCNRMLERIRYCYNCQPYENGEPVWVLGIRTVLDELFDSFRVPEKHRDELSEMLQCKNCGTNLARGDEIGLITESEIEFERRLRVWKRKYEEQLKDFYNFLSEYPYLGAVHKMGKRIIEEMELFPRERIREQDWYRARRIESGIKLKSSDMEAPDPKRVVISEGRYNHFGQSHLYLSASPEGAAREVVSGGERVVWIQKYRIKQFDPVLDLVNWWENERYGTPVVPLGLMHSGILNKRIEHTDSWKPEYFIPRFIADVAKMKGLKGILFQSSKHYERNLVLFHPTIHEYELAGDPSIFTIELEKRGSGFLFLDHVGFD